MDLMIAPVWRQIQAGSDLFISVWNIHRSPRVWADADRFNPGRWPLDGPTPNEVTEDFRYLPFGGGRRKCIGAPPTPAVPSFCKHCMASLLHKPRRA